MAKSPTPDAEWRETLEELQHLEPGLTVDSLTEAIRLLRSEKFQDLTDRQIRDIAEYRSIEIGEESFFAKPFSTGKEVSASLAYAQRIGREIVLSDLRRLAESTLGRSLV